MEKLKVVFICHFSNSDVRSKIPLSNFWLINRIKNILRKGVIQEHQDFAPWVTNQIKEFEKFEDVELHVISPHSGLKRFTYSYNSNGVNYYFFKPELPFMLSPLLAWLNLKSNKYLLNRFFIKRFIKKIKPNIINLIGTENPYYSIASLDIKNIPLYVSAQTVYSNPLRQALTGNVDEERWNLELKIHNKEKYYGVSGRMHHDLILNNNPNALIFKFQFPVQKPEKTYYPIKDHDFAFFAHGVTPKKGVEDAIYALALVKEKYQNVKLNIIGLCNPDYKQVLDDIIENLNLQSNISFNQYFPLQSDMHRHIQKSRFALLPVKLDIISSTIVEAMQLGLPLVTYKTTGTPYLNKDGETVLISSIGDIIALATNMLKFMDNPEYANELGKKAKIFAEKEFDNSRNARLLIECYRAVINHYHNNTPIPDELLFNTEEYPIY